MRRFGDEADLVLGGFGHFVDGALFHAPQAGPLNVRATQASRLREAAVQEPFVGFVDAEEPEAFA